MKSHFAILFLLMLNFPSPLLANEIIWGTPFTISAPTDLIDLGGPIHLAADFNPAETFNPENDLLFTVGPFDGVINGIQFTQADQDIAGLLETNLTGSEGTQFQNLSEGAVNASTFLNGLQGPFYRGAPTGDSDLDNLLDSHAFRGIDGMADITIQGLTVGTNYQVQLIGIADARPFAVNSVARVDNGNGVFLPDGPTLTRGLYQTVLGDFTADSLTQTIQIDDSGGLSGIVVQAIPTLGDVNRDSIVNFLDISPFIAILSADAFQPEADVDGNGVVDFFDIAPFIELLAANAG